MRFKFVEKKLKVSDELRAYAERKISKMDKFFKNETDANVTLIAERGRYRAEVTLHNNGMIYRVSELTSDMYASIDSACASIERQIRKNKTRLEKRLREGAFERDARVFHAIPDSSDEEEGEDFHIIRTKRHSIKPMTPEEAILQMNLLGHEFFVFKNQLDDEVFSVVYARKQGGYGLICADDED